MKKYIACWAAVLTLAAVLCFDRTVISFAQQLSGGGGTPGGSNTQVQYNNSGAFGGSSKFVFNSTTGAVTLAAGTLTTTSVPTTITQTWNDAAVVFNSFLINATNTASDLSSTLLDVQESGSSRFNVIANGTDDSNPAGLRIPVSPNNRRILYGFGSRATATGMSAQGTTRLGFVVNSGQIAEFNNAALTFRSASIIGWSSTNDPEDSADIGISRNAAGILEVNNGGSGVFRDVLLRQIITTPIAVGSLQTCNSGNKGARSFVTDSNAVSFTAGIGAVVAAGGSTNVPVVCDGTNWRIG